LAKQGEAVEEVLHFSSHCSESEPDESKVKDEIESQEDHLHVDQKSKEKHDDISASPIVVLGAGKALVDNQYMLLSIFELVILALVIILIIWYIYRRFFRSDKKEEIFLKYKIPINRNQGYAFPI
jgi:hypothetical protein